jgi:hypothetical protein
MIELHQLDEGDRFFLPWEDFEYEKCFQAEGKIGANAWRIEGDQKRTCFVPLDTEVVRSSRAS